MSRVTNMFMTTFGFGSMGKHLSLIILLAIGAVCFQAVPSMAADEEQTQPEKLIVNLEDAIQYALQHNPGYLRAGISLKMAELNFDYSAAIFDPTLQAQLNTKRTRTGGLSFESQVLSGTDSKVYGTQVDYSWLLHTGDAMKFSYSGNRSSYDSQLLGEEGGMLTTYTSVLGLSYSRPLLKGFGSAVTMAGIDKATIDVAISNAVKETAMDDLVYGVRNSYLAVVAVREAVGVAEVSLAEAQSLLDETRAKVEAGLFAPYQKIAAEAGLYSRDEEVIRARGEYDKALNALREIMGIGPDTPFDVQQGMDLSIVPPDAETAIEKALGNRPDLTQLKLQKKKAELDITVAHNSLKPELGFTGGFGFQGEDFDYTGSLDQMDNFSWFAGLNYIVPLGGNSAAKARMETAKLAIEEIDLQILALEERVRREVNNALVDLNNANERIRVAKAGLEAAKVKMDSEKRRFELGLITSGDLLEYEKEYSQAMLAELRARVEYFQAAALLIKLTGDY